MTDQTRDAGIDIVRAICIVLVVIWHLQPVTGAMLPAQTALAYWGGRLIHFFYFNITLLAVPSFILISLYLFIGKLSVAPDYWKKRFLRLLQVYVFWVGIQFILYLLTGGPLPLPLKTIIRSGGPDLSFGSVLPAVPSIFYYLYVLIFSTVLAFVFLKLPEKIKAVVAVAVIAGSCVYFLLTPSWGIAVDTRSMKNYYLYAPAAYYLYRCRDSFVKYRWLLLAGFIAALIVEWTAAGMTSAYARVSVFLGALAFVSFFLTGFDRVNRPTFLLSRYSLGIFALHGYSMVAVLVPYALFRNYSRALPLQSIPEGLLALVATFALTCFLVWLMAKTRLRMFVS
ncbi:MAG: acyltransferase [Deltaproteobacteria bacterium]|jgi:peptidoglycan/LPS O-acetylase OafA/YrhL|nr:acyltransferase [Deltaproteobacteria bacterium]